MGDPLSLDTSNTNTHLNYPPLLNDLKRELVLVVFTIIYSDSTVISSPAHLNQKGMKP